MMLLYIFPSQHSELNTADNVTSELPAPLLDLADSVVLTVLP
jgi:hypothetical protein